MSRPVASLSLDLDNQWSYLKTHGNPAWEAYPSYLDVVLPRMLEVLDDSGLRLTVFVVGQDAAVAANAADLRAVVDAGHEVGNHSFSHEPWFHLYDDDRVEREVADAEAAIEAATGQRPIGFRGPGYSLSRPLLDVLVDRGYAYDASILPTWIGPLARAFYFRSAKLSATEREERGKLFGNFRDALQPLHPYRWELGDTTLLELPVTVLPLARVPMHVSYVLYLEGFSPALARAYFRSSLRLCRLLGVAPSLLLHPLDLIGADDLPAGSGLEFFPGMALGGERKRRLLRDCLARYAEVFDVVPMGRHVAAIEAAGGLEQRSASFETAR